MLIPRPGSDSSLNIGASHEMLAARSPSSARPHGPEATSHLKHVRPIGTSGERQRVAVAWASWREHGHAACRSEQGGPDQGRVRTWTSWHRCSTAALTAYAFLVIAALLEHRAATDDPADLVPLNCPELAAPADHQRPGARPRLNRDHIHRWSLSRRHHPAVARAGHRAWNADADRLA